MNESKAGALRAGDGRSRQWPLRGLLLVAAATLGLAACAGPSALDGKRLATGAPSADAGAESARGPAQRQKPPHAARDQGRAETDGWGAAFDGRRSD
jgi:hypothetical protein